MLLGKTVGELFHMKKGPLLLLLLLLPCAFAAGADTCGEGTFHLSESDRCFDCPDDRWCLAGDSCRPGHSGYACSTCDDGWFFHKRGVCTECPRRREAIYAYAATAIGVCLFCLGMYVSESGHDVTTLTIVATHFQLVYVFYEIQFDYPKSISIGMGPIGV